MSLQGTLRTLGITEVLEFLAERNATGRLDISADSGDATYWMLRGEVAGAEYEFDSEVGGDAAEATYYALAELDGNFLFDESETPDPNADTEAVSAVLGRTADVAERWANIEDLIPTRDHVLSRMETFTRPVTVEPEWWTAIDAIANGASSRQLADSLELSAIDASAMAAAMARAGILEVGEPQASSAIEDSSDPEVAPVETEAEHSAEDQTEELAVESVVVEESEAVGDSSVEPRLVPADDVMEPVAAPAGEAPAPQHVAEPIEPPAEHAAPAAPIAEAPAPAPAPDVDVAPIAFDEPAPVDAAFASAPDSQLAAAEAAEELENAVQELAAMAADPEDDGWSDATYVDPSIPTEASAADPYASPFEPAPEDAVDAAATDSWADSHSAPDFGSASPAFPQEVAPPVDEDDGWTDGTTLTAPVPAPPMPGPMESTPPAGDFAAPDAALATDTGFGDLADLAELGELAEDADFGTEDRSSVLKFLRRD